MELAQKLYLAFQQRSALAQRIGSRPAHPRLDIQRIAQPKKRPHVPGTLYGSAFQCNKSRRMIAKTLFRVRNGCFNRARGVFGLEIGDNCFQPGINLSELNHTGIFFFCRPFASRHAQPTARNALQ